MRRNRPTPILGSLLMLAFIAAITLVVNHALPVTARLAPVPANPSPLSADPIQAKVHVVEPAVVSIVAGDDWHLTSEVVPEPKSGLYGFNNNALVTGQTPKITWADLQTGPDQFDWTKLDMALTQGPAVIRLKCGTPADVPKFIRNRHPEWKTFRNSDHEVELPQWSPSWLDEWQPFINALGDHAKNNPNLWGVQLQFTADGEPGANPTDMTRFEKLGFSPAVLQEFLTRYYQISLDAFSGQEWKLFSTWKPNFIYGNYQGRFSKAAYAVASENGSAGAFMRGLGIRGSGTAENYEKTGDWPDWTTTIDGVVVVHDMTFPPLALGGHIDGQLENYYGSNKGDGDAIVTDDPNKLRFAMRMSLLRAVTDEYSFLWIDGDDADFVGADLVNWVRLELGRRPDDAPDAWLVIGQFGNIKAMPRWIQPLNLDATEPGPILDTSGLGFVDNSQSLGRSLTDLRLAVDDRFLKPGGDYEVQVVVTYLDSDTTFHLEYDSTTGPMNTPTIGGSSSGDWVSTTVELPDATFAGRLEGGSDLRVVADSGVPVIQLVRIIR
ncbi:MAG: hypothetical protein WBW04_21850 [Nitrolancea sp.]